MKITISQILNDIYEDWRVKQDNVNIDEMYELLIQEKKKYKKKE